MREEYCEPVHLRVEPRAIPQLRAAFERALDILDQPLQDLGRYGRIEGQWMGDPKSAEVVAVYNARVMDAPDGQYQALLRYQEELTRIRDQLKLLETEYARMEEENAARFDAGTV